jgi:hypothetical protein
MAITRRKFVQSTGAASAAALAAACTTQSGKEQPKPKAQKRTMALDLRAPSEGQFRLEIIGLSALITAPDYMTMTAALVKAETASGLNLPKHWATLVVGRYAIDPAKTTLEPVAATEEHAIFSLQGMQVSFAGVKNGASANLSQKLSITRNNGPANSSCPKEAATWNDFDWVLKGTDLDAKVKLLGNWRDPAYNACLVEMKAGLVEDPTLSEDQDRYIYEYTWKVDSKDYKRALKEVVRYTIDAKYNGDIDAIDITVSPLGSSGAGAKTVRCNLSTPDAEDPQASKLGAIVQVVHVPYGPLHGNDLHDLRALFILTDCADITKVPVPSSTRKLCDTTATSECTCCPPLTFS